MTSAIWLTWKHRGPLTLLLSVPPWQLGIAGSWLAGALAKSSTFISSPLPSLFSSPGDFCTDKQVPMGPGKQDTRLQVGNCRPHVCSPEFKESTLQRQKGHDRPHTSPLFLRLQKQFMFVGKYNRIKAFAIPNSGPNS